MSDKVIRCAECKMDFTLTDGEQAFYQSMGYSEPKRCKPCRQARKAAIPKNHDNSPSQPAVERPAGGARNSGRRRRNNYDD